MGVVKYLERVNGCMVWFGIWLECRKDKRTKMEKFEKAGWCHFLNEDEAGGVIKYVY